MRLREGASPVGHVDPSMSRREAAWATRQMRLGANGPGNSRGLSQTGIQCRHEWRGDWAYADRGSAPAECAHSQVGGEGMDDRFRLLLSCLSLLDRRGSLPGGSAAVRLGGMGSSGDQRARAPLGIPLFGLSILLLHENLQSPSHIRMR